MRGSFTILHRSEQWIGCFEDAMTGLIVENGPVLQDRLSMTLSLPVFPPRWWNDQDNACAALVAGGVYGVVLI